MDSPLQEKCGEDGQREKHEGENRDYARHCILNAGSKRCELVGNEPVAGATELSDKPLDKREQNAKCERSEWQRECPKRMTGPRPNLARGAASAKEVRMPDSTPDTTTVAVSPGERNNSLRAPGTSDQIRPLTTPNARTRTGVLTQPNGYEDAGP